MNIFKVSNNRGGKLAALVISLLCFFALNAGATQIEQVMRDFQARHKLVTGTYIQWLKCSSGSTPAPHFPKDGFYGNLDQDPEEGARILTNLVERFYTNNAIFTAFVKAPNGYSSIENVTSIDNYAMSDMTVVSVSDVTAATYAEKLQIVADQVAKLILIQTNATQVIAANEMDSKFTFIDDQLEAFACTGVQNCMISKHSSTTFGRLAGYLDNCDTAWHSYTLYPILTFGPDGQVGPYATISRVLEVVRADHPDEDVGFHAAARNTRGKIRADLRNYRAGSVKVFLKLSKASCDESFFAGYLTPVSSCVSWFAQSAPTSADEDRYGVWVAGVLALGEDSITGYVSYSETTPAAIGTCASNETTLYGWSVSGSIAVIQPDFTTSPDTQDCCSCIACEAGTLTAELGSIQFSIGFGSDAFGSSAGSVMLDAELPSTTLAQPVALRYTTNSTTYFVKDAGTNHLQFKSSQALVNIKTNNAYYYTISVYTAADAGTTNGSGVYEPTGAAYTTITVENPDSGSASNRLRLVRTSDGSSNVTEYTYTSGQWELITGGGLRKETRVSAWDAGHTNRYETNIVRNSADVSTYKEVNVYRLFPWGEERTTNLLNPDALPSTGLRKTTWSYYTNSADTGSYRQVHQEIDADGKWTIYKYDSAGRETNRVTQFMNSDVDSAENSNRVTVTIYSTNTPQITIIEKLLGTEIGRQYKVTSSGEIRDIRCQNVGAVWNNATNLVTITRNYTNGSFAGELYRVVNPDGTVQIHLYSTNSTEKTSVVLAGIPDGGSETNITRGTITTTVNGVGGEIKSRTVKYRMSAGSDFTIDQDTYTYLDARKRSYQVAHLDGTTSEYQYSCCGLDSETDREGTTTTYIYDGLQRQIGTTRNGITTTNLLDAHGNVLATVRVGTTGTAITLSSGQYDLAGRLTNSVNAMGQATGIREFIDPVTSAPTRRTTYPDGGITIETFAKDGTASKITGGPARNTRYTSGIETSGPDTDSQYSQEIKLTASGADTAETTTQYFDAAGRVYKTLFSDGAYSQSYFNSKGQLAKEVDPDGVTTLYGYNDLGELGFTVLDMDRDGDIDWAGTDRISQSTNDVLTSHSTTVHRTRQYAWAADGVSTPTLVSTRETSADGLQSWSESFGVTSHTGTKFAGGGLRYITNTLSAGNYTLSRFENGRLVSVTNSGGTGGTTFAYDTHGRQSTATDARNGTTTYTFNNADQISSVTTPSPGGGQSAQVTTNHFDVMGRIWKVGLPDNTSVTNEFNGTGDLTKTYGSRTYPVQYQHDAHGRATNMITWTAYPSTGSASTKWKYNERGFVTNKLYADNQGPSYTYTPAGRLLTRVWARGITTTYTTNAAGEVATVVYSDGTPGMTNTYDRLGRLTTVIQGTNTTTMLYGDAGQLLSETCNGFTVTNSYDSVLRRSSVSVAGYSSTLALYAYDAASRLSSVTNGSYTATYSYHTDSPLVSSITFRDGATTRLTTAKSYDNLNRLTQISSTPGSGPAITFNYAYDPANQRTTVTNADSRWAYQYDSLGQVTSGKRYWTDGTVVAGQQFEYSFDDIGNRKYAGSGGDEWGSNVRFSRYSANNLNQYSSRTVPGNLNVVGSATNTSLVTVNDGATSRKGAYYRGEVTADNTGAAVYLGITNLAVLNQGTNADIVTNIIGNLFVPQTPEAFFYDVDGNLTNDGRWIYSWDAENRLTNMTANTSIPSAAKLKLDFLYDYRGRRTSKIVSTNSGSYVAAYTNKFVYDDWNLVVELDHTNGLTRNFVWGTDLSGTSQGAGGVGGLLAVTSIGNGTHFYAYDGNGNPTTLTSSTNGNVTAEYEYGPFGELLRATGPMAKANPVRFSTKYEDAETECSYYGHRYYAASMGRWLSRDPIEEQGGPNVSAFVDNNAISNVDLFGLLNIVRLGFKGAGDTEGVWLTGLTTSQKFAATDEGGAMKFILKQLDTNGDGKVTDCDDEADIRITGYSWGGWTAVQLARELNGTKKIKSKVKNHRRVRLGLLDPVDTARRGSDTLTPNVYFAFNVFQKNGCYKGRCPGPSSWYKGRPITGATNVDVTTDRPTAPLGDGVPLSMVPDHVHLMENYHGYATVIGFTLWLIPFP